MNKRLRFGIVGVGRRGLRHLKALKEFKEVEVACACDIDETKLKRVVDEYGVKAYKDLDEMFNREKIDVVIISTPIVYHVPQALICLRKGSNVILEKPVSLSLSELKELLKVTKESKKLVVVGFQLRYSELVDLIKDVIDKRTLSMLAGYWYWTIPLVPWIRKRDLAGGQIVEQAVHLVDLFRYLAGDVEKVSAFYTEKGRDFNEDLKSGFMNWASYTVIFKFKNDVVGSLHTTYALYPGIFKKEEGHSVTLDVICRELLVRYVPGVEVKVFRKGEETKTYRSSTNPLIRMYRVIIDALLTGDWSIVRTPYEDSYKTMVTVLAANESARSERVVCIDEYEKGLIRKI